MNATRTGYDNGAWGATPTKGLPTCIANPDGTGVGYSVVTGRSYAPLGRLRKITDPLKGITETQYTPADIGGPVTEIKTINPKGRSSTTTYDPGRGLTLTVACATADCIKVTSKNGKIVSVDTVDTWDANENNAKVVDADNTAKTVSGRMNGEAKGQTQNVVYVAKSQAEAEAIRDRLVGNKHVRVIWLGGSFDTHRVQPLVRKIGGGTIRITPGEAQGKAPTVPEAPSAPRTGGGSRVGKLMGGLGVIGDLYMIWDATRSWQRGCDGWLGSCDPPPMA